jgi:hypothetical protein
MIDPVPRGIRDEGIVVHSISVDSVIELEEDTEASLCEGGMRRFGENVIVRKTFFSRRESLRYKVLLDGEVRELYNSVAFPIDDGDETRTCRHHCFF